MYDTELVCEIVDQIIVASTLVKERCLFATKEDDFIDTKEGQEKLDSICMKLVAIGESLKNIDKITDSKLLANYPQIEWKKIKGIRDFISHHYFDLDADVIYDICQNHIESLISTLKLIRQDLEEPN